MRVRNELDRLAAVRPQIVPEAGDVVDGAEEDRLLRQILATARPVPGRAGRPGGRVARRHRAGLLAGGLGLAAAAVAVAVTLASGPATAPAGPPAAGHNGPVRPSARQILLTAATAAAAGPGGSGRYWYTEVTTSLPGYRETDKTWTARGGDTQWVWAGKKTHDRVMRFTGSPVGFWLGGDPGTLTELENRPVKPRLLKPKPTPPSPVLPGQVTFGQLQRLPADPAALKAWIVAFNRDYQRQAGLPDPGHVMVFLSLTNLVAALPAPPRVRAAAFRALATLPDVTSLGPVRGGQGIRLSLGGDQDATLVVDPTTSQVRDTLTVSGSGRANSVSVAGHWTNRRP